MDNHRNNGGASLHRTISEIPGGGGPIATNNKPGAKATAKKSAASVRWSAPPVALSTYCAATAATEDNNNEPSSMTATKLDDAMPKKGTAAAPSCIRTLGRDGDSRQLGLATADAARPHQEHQTEKIIPVVEQATSYEPAKAAVPRTRPPRPTPALDGRPIVLATHLVPSLPVDLFEVLAEAIEVVTARPVVVLYESRNDRPVAKDVVDIAILPAGETWEAGDLLPISFVFEHRLNKNFSPAVYADVVVATDRAPHVEGIMDLRGHRCAFPDRKRALGAANLLFNHLRAKGEGPSFFGNTLDANSQLSALQMVAGKQVEVCILESPVIRFHRKSLPGVYSLHILTSLGPLPPYAIMTNKNMPNDVVNKIKDYLLNIHQDSEWVEKFAPYSVLGFAEYSNDNFDVEEIKSVATSAPYY